jgi:hypothetical protein
MIFIRQKVNVQLAGHFENVRPKVKQSGVLKKKTGTGNFIPAR